MSFPISDRHEIYLKADSEDLFVGLKSALPLGLMLSEIHVTSNEKVFIKLHSSARLGEGSGAFPSDFRQSKFGVDNAQDWEANVDVMEKIKEEEWIAQGRPTEKYDDIFKKKDGKEYRISLKKLAGSRLRMIAGLRDSKGTVNFPRDGTLENCDNWLELILPGPIK
ncbi:MAG: hypothetical protein OEW05_00105 [Candidatus Aminicenantes bacterium]|nr:hypothetical protein [Candidatus Aminicenantes bacterium]